ncbi:unnamed protein product [Ixodes pacificus]
MIHARKKCELNFCRDRVLFLCCNKCYNGLQCCLITL